MLDIVGLGGALQVERDNASPQMVNTIHGEDTLETICSVDGCDLDSEDDILAFESPAHRMPFRKLSAKRKK